MNFSDEKVSSSTKSVKFSNRLDENRSVNSKREGSRTPSILKNKNKKYGSGSGLSSIPSEVILDEFRDPFPSINLSIPMRRKSRKRFTKNQIQTPS
jgi:hypothetical protein